MIGKLFRRRANVKAEAKEDVSIRGTILAAFRIGATTATGVATLFKEVTRYPNASEAEVVVVNANNGQDIACTCTFTHDRLSAFSIYYKETSEELCRLGGFSGLTDSISSKLGPPTKKSGDDARMWRQPNLRIIVARQTAGSVRFGVNTDRKLTDAEDWDHRECQLVVSVAVRHGPQPNRSFRSGLIDSSRWSRKSCTKTSFCRTAMQGS